MTMMMQFTTRQLPFPLRQDIETYYNYDNIYDFVGRGTSASVFRGIVLDTAVECVTTHDSTAPSTTLTEGMAVALKVISKRNLTSERHIQDVINEVEVCKMVHHPNCPELLDCFQTPNHVVLVQTYMEGSKDLLTVLQESSSGHDPMGNHTAMTAGQNGWGDDFPLLSESEKKSIIFQLLQALAYLHGTIGVVHRDVKPENILLAKPEGAEHYHLMLVDFGLSRHVGVVLNTVAHRRPRKMIRRSRGSTTTTSTSTTPAACPTSTPVNPRGEDQRMIMAGMRGEAHPRHGPSHDSNATARIAFSANVKTTAEEAECDESMCPRPRQRPLLCSACRQSASRSRWLPTTTAAVVESPSSVLAAALPLPSASRSPPLCHTTTPTTATSATVSELSSSRAAPTPSQWLLPSSPPLPSLKVAYEEGSERMNDCGMKENKKKKKEEEDKGNEEEEEEDSLPLGGHHHHQHYYHHHHHHQRQGQGQGQGRRRPPPPPSSHYFDFLDAVGKAEATSEAYPQEVVHSSPLLPCETLPTSSSSVSVSLINPSYYYPSVVSASSAMRISVSGAEPIMGRWQDGTAARTSSSSSSSQRPKDQNRRRRQQHEKERDPQLQRTGDAQEGVEDRDGDGWSWCCCEGCGGRIHGTVALPAPGGDVCSGSQGVPLESQKRIDANANAIPCAVTAGAGAICPSSLSSSSSSLTVTEDDGSGGHTPLDTTPCGTLLYAAPETVRSFQQSSLRTTRARLPLVDMYSVGVILYLLLSGRFPFASSTKVMLDREMRAGANFEDAFWCDHVSPDALALTRLLLVYEPEERLSAFAALAHGWFDDLRSRTPALGKSLCPPAQAGRSLTTLTTVPTPPPTAVVVGVHESHHHHNDDNDHEDEEEEEEEEELSRERKQMEREMIKKAEKKRDEGEVHCYGEEHPHSHDTSTRSAEKKKLGGNENSIITKEEEDPTADVVAHHLPPPPPPCASSAPTPDSTLLSSSSSSVSSSSSSSSSSVLLSRRVLRRLLRPYSEDDHDHDHDDNEEEEEEKEGEAAPASAVSRRRAARLRHEVKPEEEALGHSPLRAVPPLPRRRCSSATATRAVGVADPASAAADNESRGSTSHVPPPLPSSHPHHRLSLSHNNGAICLPNTNSSVTPTLFLAPPPSSATSMSMSVSAAPHTTFLSYACTTAVSPSPTTTILSAAASAAAADTSVGGGGFLSQNSSPLPPSPPPVSSIFSTALNTPHSPHTTSPPHSSSSPILHTDRATLEEDAQARRKLARVRAHHHHHQQQQQQQQQLQSQPPHHHHSQSA